MAQCSGGSDAPVDIIVTLPLDEEVVLPSDEDEQNELILPTPIDSDDDRDDLDEELRQLAAQAATNSDSDSNDELPRGHATNTDSESDNDHFPLSEVDESDESDPELQMADATNNDAALYPDQQMYNYKYDSHFEEDADLGWEWILDGPDPGAPEGQPPFIGQPGTTVQGTAPMDFFEGLFRDTMWGEMAHQTNLYAEKRLDQLGGDVVARMDHADFHRHARINTWKQVTAYDMKCFVSHLLIMGLVRKPSIESYWSKKGLDQTPFFGKFMSRRRFQEILSNFHVADDSNNPPRGQPGHNPLAKIQPFIDMTRDTFLAAYSPGKNISIDEGCCPWKGRLVFKQYNPRKPARFHIKLFQVSDPVTGYVVHYSVYTGEGSCLRDGIALDCQAGTTTKTVLTLAHDSKILNKGHNLYFDNYFTSPELLEELWSKGTPACGTARHRVGAPLAMKMGKPQKKELKMKSGDCFYRRKGNLLAFKWEQKRTVYMMTTLHDAVLSYTGKKERGTGEPIYKPKAVIDYTKHMGGVDLSDQLMNYYHFLRRSCKWWRKLWVHLFNMTVMNAYVLNKAYGAKQMSHTEYRHYLAVALLGIENVDQPMNVTIVRGNGHYPERLPISTKTRKVKTRICIYCKVTKPRDAAFHGVERRKASTIMCAICRVPLCTYPCFGLYHG